MNIILNQMSEYSPKRSIGGKKHDTWYLDTCLPWIIMISLAAFMDINNTKHTKKQSPFPPTLKFQVFVCFNFLVFWVYPSVHANPFNGCLANSTKQHEEYAEQQCESENTNANNKPKGNLIYVIINLLSNFVKHLFRLDWIVLLCCCFWCLL